MDSLELAPIDIINQNIVKHWQNDYRHCCIIGHIALPLHLYIQWAASDCNQNHLYEPDGNDFELPPNDKCADANV